MAKIIEWYHGTFAVATIQGRAALIHASGIGYGEAVDFAKKLNEDLK